MAYLKSRRKDLHSRLPISKVEVVAADLLSLVSRLESREYAWQSENTHKGRGAIPLCHHSRISEEKDVCGSCTKHFQRTLFSVLLQ